MTPDMVAALERQSSVEQTDEGRVTDYRWRLVGEGIVVELSVIEGYGYTSPSGFGVHARQPFGLRGEWWEASFETTNCTVAGGGAWCAADVSRAGQLVKQWAKDRDHAPIWAALEALAGEVER